MNYEKAFYFVEVTNMQGKKSYYGKNKREIPLGDDNIGWYLKEYGFDTVHEAFCEINNLGKWFKCLNIAWQGMNVAESKVLFNSYEEYLRVKH